MEVNFKYFQISSISFKENRFMYAESKDITLYFNNYFQNFKRASEVLEVVRKRIDDFKSIANVNGVKAQIIQKNIKKVSGFAFFDDLLDIEKIIIVLMKYGFSKDFIINKMFDGYPSEHLGNPELEVKGKLLNNSNLLFEVPIHPNLPSKERMICLAKEKTVYPLFLDVNHNLFSQYILKYDSNFCISEFIKNIIFK